jgi:hypothetical protein
MQAFSPASEISIRSATTNDAPEILACLQAAFAPYRDFYTPAAYLDTVLASAYPKYTLVRHAFSADLSTPCKDESDQKAFSTNSPMILFIFEDLQKYLKEMIPMTLWLGVKTVAPAQTTLYQRVIDSTKVGCNVEVGVRVRVLIYALVVHLLLPAGVPFYLSSPHPPTCSRRAEILQVFDLQLIA